MTDDDKTALDSAILDGDFTSNGFMKRTGAGSYSVDTNTYLTSIPSSYLQNVSEDSSPQLGANLDIQSYEITTSTSNGNIILNPNGSGVVEIKGDGTTNGTVGTIKLNCSNNNHGVQIKSPPHSANASYTLTLPNADGSANQFIKTDGNGNLSFSTISVTPTSLYAWDSTSNQVVLASNTELTINGSRKLSFDRDSSNTNTVSFIAPSSQPNDITFTLPAADGSSGLSFKNRWKWSLKLCRSNNRH